MGYTRYWTRTEKPITPNFIVQVCEIIAQCDDYGIKICGGMGIGNPYITMNEIHINGGAAHDLMHESFDLVNKQDPEDREFQFCKTAEKPYDYAVREILKAAEAEGLVTNVDDDGEYNEVISDQEYIRRYR